VTPNDHAMQFRIGSAAVTPVGGAFVFLLLSGFWFVLTTPWSPVVSGTQDAGGLSRFTWHMGLIWLGTACVAVIARNTLEGWAGAIASWIVSVLVLILGSWLWFALLMPRLADRTISN